MNTISNIEKLKYAKKKYIALCPVIIFSTKNFSDFVGGMLPGFIVNQRFLVNTLKILKIFGETKVEQQSLKIFLWCQHTRKLFTNIFKDV